MTSSGLLWSLGLRLHLVTSTHASTICRLGTMDCSCSFWIDFRNQRWDFHAIHSFHGKLSKWGNYFGIVNTILSGTIDYILGNKAAIITYPVTFLIYTFAIKKWELRKKGRPNPNEPKTAKIGGHHHFHHRLPLCLCDQLLSAMEGKMNLLAYVTTSPLHCPSLPML